MVYCNYCEVDVEVEADDANGFSCCVQCGRVLEDTAFSADVTFQKDAGGESTVLGQFVNEAGVARGIGRIHGGRVYSYSADSHEKAQQRGRHDIAHLVDQLSVRPREESIESAHRLYKIALQRGFTRGRRTNQVAAACLYLVCRQDSKPFLLIDFSDVLQINVFTLGAVFLQLAKLLRVTEHPMFAKPVDPSLYIHRFADRLDFGRQMHQVANTALRLVASMKRDWIQTGRRPSGICGAAIYIAAHIHGFERSIRDIVSVVHIGEHTLSKRLYEFSHTSASTFTADEFEERAKQIEHEETQRLETAPPTDAPAGLLESAGCEHLRAGDAHFAHGMCKACYLEFIQSSGGVSGGANPPAYDRARRKEEAELLALPEPGSEETTEDALAEEHDIAVGMREAFHDERLQQFAAFLPSSAEELAAEEEEAAAAAAAAARRARKRKAGVDEDEQQQQQQQQQPQAEQQQQQQPEAMQGVEAAQRTQDEQQQQEQQPAEAAAAADKGSGEPGGSPTAAAAPAAGLGPSQVSDQTGAAAPAAAAGAAAAGTDGAAEAAAAHGAAAHAGTHSQRSEQTAAPGSSGEDEEGGQQQQQDGAQQPRPEEEVEEEGDDTLSDIADEDIEMYLAGEAEVRCKEEIWNMMNRDWLEKQAAKRAAQEAAEKAAAEANAAQEAAEAAGVQYKRGRGRPVGSKTKNHRPGLPEGPPAETAQEAAMRMLDHRKLSSKINYSALADLFADDGGAPGEPPALAPEALEGEEEGGQGAAVSAAMLQRQQEAAEEAAKREAKQAAALAKERQRVGGLGLHAPGGGLGAGRLGGAGPLSPRAGGLSRRVGGLGSLKDGNFRSQMTSSLGGAGGSTKKVRFAD